MKKTQSGFTMIELIVVIVILGILAVTALPKFINMRGDAQLASVQGVAGAAAAAMNLNFAGCALTNNVVTADKCVTINSCAGTGSLLQGSALPAGYATSGVGPGSVNGGTGACTVTGGGASSTFIAIAAGN